MEDLVEEEKEEEVLGSSSTMEKVAAAKKFIENHYRAQMKNIQERKERYVMEGTFSSVFIVILWTKFAKKKFLWWTLSLSNFGHFLLKSFVKSSTMQIES